ncbi:MAG: hypothetical protein M3340_17230 [Actinomycetota bacterium]|nr:hypothetical protein [Actinomycetota bacterium]
MSEPPLHRPIADHLPPVFQEDPASWAQVRSFLGLVDALDRGHLADLEDVTTWLSPDARAIWPPGAEPGSDPVAAYQAVFAFLAERFAYRFPESWGATDADVELDRKRDFLLRVARMWRRRGTPRGFVDWLVFSFRLAKPAQRPILVEHFKYRPPDDTSGANPGDVDPYAHRVTLLVRVAGDLKVYQRRRELREWVRANAPAHLLVRVCWVDPKYKLDLSKPDQVRAELAQLGDFTPEEDGIAPCRPAAAGRPARIDDPRDRLGIGVLPGRGRRTS